MKISFIKNLNTASDKNYLFSSQDSKNVLVPHFLMLVKIAMRKCSIKKLIKNSEKILRALLELYKKKINNFCLFFLN